MKLPRLPDRTPVKLTIALTPELKHSLEAYAAAYGVAYGETEAIADLVPFMLKAFLDSDREFVRNRRGS